MICIKPPSVAYPERNSLFNFDKMVLGYVKTVMDSPALSTTFSNQSLQIEIFFTDLETTQTTTSGAGETISGIIVWLWL